MLIEVVQFSVERFHPTKNGQTNATSSHSANVHAWGSHVKVSLFSFIAKWNNLNSMTNYDQ